MLGNSTVAAYLGDEPQLLTTGLVTGAGMYATGLWMEDGSCPKHSNATKDIDPIREHSIQGWNASTTGKWTWNGLGEHHVPHTQARFLTRLAQAVTRRYSFGRLEPWRASHQLGSLDPHLPVRTPCYNFTVRIGRTALRHVWNELMVQCWERRYLGTRLPTSWTRNTDRGTGLLDGRLSAC